MLVSKIPFLSSIVNGDIEISNMGLSRNKDKEKMLCFCETEEFISEINENSNIVGVLAREEIRNKFRKDIAVIVVENPRKLFYQTHNYLAEHTWFYRKDADNCIDESCKIYPGVYIAGKNVCIGKNVIIEPNVTIFENVTIHENVIIRAGSVIGSEGFQHVRSGEEILSVKHAGGVILHRNVEVGANCCIDKGLFGGNTIIGESSKLDNLVHIAHECNVGKRCFFAANAMLSGSVSTGDDVWIGPSATIANVITIENKAKISLGSVVIDHVKEGKTVSGNFAIDHWKFLRSMAERLKKK